MIGGPPITGGAHPAGPQPAPSRGGEVTQTRTGRQATSRRSTSLRMKRSSRPPQAVRGRSGAQRRGPPDPQGRLKADGEIAYRAGPGKVKFRASHSLCRIYAARAEL